LETDGKFGRAALAISIVASVMLLVMFTLSLFLVMTGRGTTGINYFIGMTILFCWLFELVATVVGIIGIFESSKKKRFALAAIAISLVCFFGTFVPVIIGKNGGFH
jgi:hypothetical protein